jgi:hypothetical protein
MIPSSAVDVKPTEKRTPADVGKHSLRLTEMKAGICVSTVSIVSGSDTGRPHRVPAD